MLDIKFIRENPDKIKQAAKDKGVEVDIQKLLDIDLEYRNLSTVLQELYAQRNSASKERDIETGKGLKSEIDSKEGRLSELKKELNALLYSIPNPSKEDVKVGPLKEFFPHRSFVRQLFPAQERLPP